MSRRGRRKKGNVPPGKFAPIPVDVAKAVMAVLSAPELRVWLALCLQCQHWNNGTGKLCRSVIREYHLGSQRVVTAATRKLIEKGHIVRTRKARQRTCALYGVKHIELNHDAMEKAGAIDPLSDTNSGSANSATTSEALSDKTNISGSARPIETPLALPMRKRIGPFLAALALPQGNTSKNLPSGSGIPDASSGRERQPDHAMAGSQQNVALGVAGHA